MRKGIKTMIRIPAETADLRKWEFTDSGLTEGEPVYAQTRPSECW